MDKQRQWTSFIQLVHQHWDQTTRDLPAYCDVVDLSYPGMQQLNLSAVDNLLIRQNGFVNWWNAYFK